MDISRAGSSASALPARPAHGADGRTLGRSRHPARTLRQWVISVPKRLRGFLGDRPEAVAAVTKIFLAEIERLLFSKRLLCGDRLLCAAAASSCRARMGRQRSCPRHRSRPTTWRRSANRSAAACSAGSSGRASSIRKPLPTCAPGRRADFRWTRASESHSSTATFPDRKPQARARGIRPLPQLPLRHRNGRGSHPATAEAPASLPWRVRPEPPAAADRDGAGKKGMSAHRQPPRPAGSRGMIITPAAATPLISPAPTTRHGLPGLSSWLGRGKSFYFGAPAVAATSS